MRNMNGKDESACRQRCRPPTICRSGEALIGLRTRLAEHAVPVMMVCAALAQVRKLKKKVDTLEKSGDSAPQSKPLFDDNKGSG